MSTPSSKTEDRRSEILDKLADYVLAEGVSASSLRPLAEAAETSDRMLLYYFKDKAELMEATLTRVAERMVTLLGGYTAQDPLPMEVLRNQLAQVLIDDAAWPYMRVWLEIASLSAAGTEPYRQIGEQIGRGFLAWGESQLDSASPDARRKEAAQLLAFIEGLVLLKSIGLDDACRDALD